MRERGRVCGGDLNQPPVNFSKFVVYIASTTWEEEDNPLTVWVSGRVGCTTHMFTHPTPTPSMDCHPLPRLHLQCKQRWHLFQSLLAIMAILQKNSGLRTVYFDSENDFCFKLSKHQSLLPTVLFRTTLTRTIMLDKLGSNNYLLSFKMFIP